MSNKNDDANKTGAITILDLGTGALANVEMPPCLVLLAGSTKYTGEQWLLEKPETILGRVAPATIIIDEGGISKTHAKFENVSGRLTITDLGATNKTSLNGQMLEPFKPHALKNNDQIRAGNLIFKFLQKGILTETNEKARMQGELEKARSIQSTLLPASQEARYKMVKIGGRYRTASECGGDWWWHWSNKDKAFAIIGDATGHGAGAALITSAARSAVATLEDDATASLERVYTTLSRSLHRCAGGALTMSAFIVEVDLNEPRLRYINASHLPAVWLPQHRAADLVWNSLFFLSEAVSGPLGAAQADPQVCESPAPAGTRLVLLTDGLTERKNPMGLFPSERAFYRMLIKAHASHPASQPEFLDQLLTLSDDLAESAPLDDDITVVALDFL